MFRQRSSDFLKNILDEYIGEKSILIIDDEKEIGNLVCGYLIRAGVNEQKILITRSGKVAIQKLTKNEIGLIIIDIFPPKLMEVGFIQNIKNKEKYKRIPIIISSKNFNYDHVHNAISYDVKGILVKPFSYDSFIDSVAKAVCS